MSNSSVFKSRLKVPRSSADLQLYDSEFQTEGALTQNAFADNVSCNQPPGQLSLPSLRGIEYRLTLCVPIWQAVSRSSEAEFRRRAIRIFFNLLTQWRPAGPLVDVVTGPFFPQLLQVRLVPKVETMKIDVSTFYTPKALSVAQTTTSKHWTIPALFKNDQYAIIQTSFTYLLYLLINMYQ